MGSCTTVPCMRGEDEQRKRNSDFVPPNSTTAARQRPVPSQNAIRPGPQQFAPTFQNRLVEIAHENQERRNAARHLQYLQTLLLLFRLIRQDEEEPQGLTPEEIQKIETIQATQRGSCAVCQDETKIGEVLMKLSCHHSFHEDCIRPWFEHSRRCPLCRAQLSL